MSPGAVCSDSVQCEVTVETDHTQHTGHTHTHTVQTTLSDGTRASYSSFKVLVLIKSK